MLTSSCVAGSIGRSNTISITKSSSLGIAFPYSGYVLTIWTPFSSAPPTVSPSAPTPNSTTASPTNTRFMPPLLVTRSCSGDRIRDQPTHFPRPCVGHPGLHDIGRAIPPLQDQRHRALDRGGVVFEVERVPQHHRRRQNGGDGVGRVLAGDIRRAPVDGFVQPDPPPQARRRQHPDRPRQHGRFVA